MYNIFGFSGKIGSGKDYVSKKIFLPLLKHHRCEKVLFLAFADCLKQQCSLKYGSTYEKLYEKKDDVTRGHLQELADDIKKSYGQDAYVNALKMNIMVHHYRSDIDCFIITDVRFPQEMKMIKDLGGYVFRIEAPERTLKKLKEECGDNYKKRASHISETALDNAKFDATIYNDEKDNPEKSIQELISVAF